MPATVLSTVNTRLGCTTGDQSIKIRIPDETDFLANEATSQLFADFVKIKVLTLMSKNPIPDSDEEIQPFSETEVDEAIKTFKSKKVMWFG